MAAKIALCLDEITCRNPETIGLSGENLELQSWLDVHIGGVEARQGLGENLDVEEVWVAACDDVESINLAAVLKEDRPELIVRLLDCDGGGSVLSRAHTAGIDEVMGQRAFVERYTSAKRAVAGIDGQVRPAIAKDPSDQTVQDGGISKEGLCEGGKREPRSFSARSDQPAAESGLEQRAQAGAHAGSGLFSKMFSPAASANDGASDSKRSARLTAGVATIVAKEEVKADRPRVLLSLDDDTNTSLKLPLEAGLTRSQGFLLPVVSGSGGAGKSTVSVLAAFAAKSRGLKTLLLDYDLQFGDASIMAGIESPLTIDQLIAHPEALDKTIVDDRHPAILAPPLRLEDAESVVAHVPELLNLVMSAFDVVIANTGAAWGEQHAALLERSNAVLFLVDQRSSSVRACRHALELCSRCGIATGQFQYVLNRCAKNAPLTSIDVSCALQGASVAELKEGGRDVEEYLAAGAALELMETGNDLYASIQALIGEMLPVGGAQVVERAPGERSMSLGKRRGRHASKRKGWGK